MKNVIWFLPLLAVFLVGNGHAAPAALQFDGVNDYVTFGQATSTLGASNFTIECWFKRTGPGQTASTGTGGLIAVPLVTNGCREQENSNRDLNYFLGIDSTGVISADFESFAFMNNNAPVKGHTQINTGVWYHVAATYDGSFWSLYLNGQLETNLAVSLPNRVQRHDSIQHAGVATALNSTGATNGLFQGIMDEIRIWNHARAQSQIQATMSNEVTSGTGLLGRWGFNEGEGDIAGNSVAGSPSGILSNGPMWVTDSPFRPPSVAMTSPADGANVRAGTNLLVAAVAAYDGIISSVEFYVFLR